MRQKLRSSIPGTFRRSLLLAGFLGLAVAANAQVIVTKYAVKDAYLRKGANNTNEGANKYLENADATNENRPVVAFDLSGVSTSGLTKAELVMKVVDNASNWGTSGAHVYVYRLSQDWTEGNGCNENTTSSSGFNPGNRGTGEGSTWQCPKDANINNTSDDGATWSGLNTVSSNGGSFFPGTAAGVLITNSTTGDITWDVTQDVLNGAGYGWIIKGNTGEAIGRVRYASREYGTQNDGPRLVLTYANPGPPYATVENYCGYSVLTATNLTPGATVTWSDNSTDNPHTVYSGGTYTATQTVNGNTSAPSNPVTAAPKTIPGAPTAAVVDNCNNTSTLTASNYTGALTWSDNGTDNPHIVSTSGPYTVTQTVDGCTSAPSNEVTANPKTTPDPPVASVTDHYWGTSDLSASGIASGATILWSDGGTDNPHTIYYTTNQGDYTVTQTLNGCTSDPSNTVTANPSTSLTLYSSKDAFLRDGVENTNEGANPKLRIQNTGNNRVVVGFDMANVSHLERLTSASLIMNIVENADNWGGGAPGTRYVDACRLLTDWTEGNGWNDDGNIRGTGAGVTWQCPTDANVNNSSKDGATWSGFNNIGQNGGLFATPTAAGVLHYNGLLGEVSWTVTADVLAGAGNGWLIKKRNEGANGRVYYSSKEGDADKKPKLVLSYSGAPPTSPRMAQSHAEPDHFVFYPNPANERVLIEYIAAGTTRASVTVVSTSGQIVLNEVFSTEEGRNIQMLDVRQLSSGLYFVNFECGTVSKHMKLLIYH